MKAHELKTRYEAERDELTRRLQELEQQSAQIARAHAEALAQLQRVLGGLAALEQLSADEAEG